MSADKELDGPCPRCGHQSLAFRRNRTWGPKEHPQKGDRREHRCVRQGCGWWSTAEFDGHEWVWRGVKKDGKKWSYRYGDKS